MERKAAMLLNEKLIYLSKSDINNKIK